MKLIRNIIDLNKAINKEKELGFIPTMGSLHKGHKFLIQQSQKRCNKTLVTIFINPTQFNNKDDYKKYPKNLNEDLIILKKLKVDFVYLPTISQIYKHKNFPKITLKKSQKILCAKFRKGHFEGVLDVLNRFTKLISPKIMFMGEKDYQQYFLVKDYISKKYDTQVLLCKTIRNSNGVALSSRIKLLNKSDLNKLGLITSKLMKIKRSIYMKNKYKSMTMKISNALIQKAKIKLIKKFNIRVEYLECRNLINLKKSINNKPFKLFFSCYINNVRLIDNF